MAKQRIVNTRFWIDDYISNLDPTEKLLFLYFLTNPSTDICGVYEVPLKTIATDTGIEIEMVKKILKRFSKDKRVFYVDGWVGIKNFAKHQSDSPSVKKGIEIGLKKAPKEILDRVYTESIEGVPPLSHLNLNSNSNLNLNSNLNREVSLSLLGEFKNVKISEEEYQKLIEKMGEKNTNILIEELSTYMASKKTGYLKHYAVIQSWARRKVQDHQLKNKTRTIV